MSIRSVSADISGFLPVASKWQIATITEVKPHPAVEVRQLDPAEKIDKLFPTRENPRLVAE